MKLENVRILASVSAQYQKAEVEMVISNLDSVNENIESVKAIVVDKAISTLNDILNKQGMTKTEEPKVETKVETVQPQQYKAASYPVEHQTQPQRQSKQEVETACFDGFWYKKCYNKDKKEFFWALLNIDDMNRGAKRYHKA